MATISHSFSLSDLDHMLECKVKLFFASQNHEKFNFIGRILGRKGENLQSIETECQCRISILGRGSLRNKDEENQLEAIVGYEHLKEDLHILITVHATPEQAFFRVSRAITILKPYLHPDTAVNVHTHYRHHRSQTVVPANIPQNISIVSPFIFDSSSIGRKKSSKHSNCQYFSKPYSR